MKKNIKQILAFGFIFTMLFTYGASATDIAHIEYAPKLSSQQVGIATRTYTFDLDKSNGRAVYEGSVMGTTGVTQSSVSASIQRYYGGYWHDVPGSYVINTTNTNTASFQRVFYVEKGYLYRMQVVFTCYIGSTKYSDSATTGATSYA